MHAVPSLAQKTTSALMQFPASSMSAAYKGLGSTAGPVGLSVECMDGSSADPTFATSAIKLYAFDDPAKG